MVTHSMKDGTMTSSGAAQKMAFSDSAGTMSSFSISFMPSATG